MNNKYKQIDDFLKMWRDVSFENPDINFIEERDMIYRQLTRLNVSLNERKLEINKLYFNSWIKRFKYIKNIDCFVSHNWQYFCQFVNKSTSQNENIKLYIPLDSQHIYEGTNMIFEFLSKNNISHQSKVGKHIRFDNIVIRLDKEDDLDLVLNFINNNAYIQEGLIQPNPFAYNKDGIALACDGGISYNSTIATLISIYMEEKRTMGLLSEISINDFYSFVGYYYNKVFMNKDYNKFISDFNIEDIDENTYEFTNYKQVLALIIKTADPNFTFDDYIGHFKMCKQGRENTDYLNNRFTSTLDESKEIDLNMDDLLLETMDVMTRKYGRDHAVKCISNYLNTGAINCITRDNNLRNRVVNSNFRDVINDRLNKSNLSLEQYVLILEQKYQKPSNKEQILISALMSNYNKYESINNSGKQSIFSALMRLTKDNSYLGFTRQNGAREMMIKNVTSNDVIEIFKQKYGYQDLSDDMLNQVCNIYTNEIINMPRKLS